MAKMTNVEKPTGLGVVPLGIALAVTLVLGYAACWLTVAILPFGSHFAHSWLALFSTYAEGSPAQLVEGAIYSLLVGWFAALVFAPTYNLATKAGRVI
jgi:hypothetical protein